MAAPPVALTPVNDGIAKYVLAHAAGADVDMLAALVIVTVSVPLAPTVSGLVRVCDEPLLAVA